MVNIRSTIQSFYACLVNTKVYYLYIIFNTIKILTLKYHIVGI